MINPLNELSDIYLGNISEEDNSPEAVKGRVMQYVRAIRYRARKEGETLNKAYNEFMGSQAGVSGTEKQMVKERLGLTGGSAHMGESSGDELQLQTLQKKQLQLDMRKLKLRRKEMNQNKTSSLATAQKEKENVVTSESIKVKYPDLSNWRSELREISDADPVTEKDADRKITEKKIKNKVDINPTLGQMESVAARLGAELVEMYEVTEDYETKKRKEVLAALKRDKRPLDKKTKDKIAAKIVKDKGDTSKSDDRYAYEETEVGDYLILEKEVDVKDTRRTVDAIRAYDRSKDASRDADWDTLHGKKAKGKKEKAYAKKERGEIDKDDPKWVHRKYHTGIHGESVDLEDANGNPTYQIIDVIKPAPLKKTLPVAHFELSEEVINESVEAATDFFYQEGINEEGLDLIVEEVGIDEFTEFVLSGTEFLTEEEEGKPAKRLNVRNLKAVKKKAEEIKAKTSDVVKRKTSPKDALQRASNTRAFKQPKLAKPSTPSKPISKVVTATKKAKEKQSEKKANRPGLLGKVRGLVQKGVERDKEAVRGVRKLVRRAQRDTTKVARHPLTQKITQAAKTAAGKGARAVSKGADVVAKKLGESKLTASEIAKAESDKKRKEDIKRKKAKALAKGKQRATGVLKKYDTDGDGYVRTIDAGYEPEGEMIDEKDLNAAERRALPDKDFALPGQGKGPKGKQAGSYPIPDKNHARLALAMVAKYGTSAKKRKVRDKVKSKFPNIEVDESVTDEAKKKAKMKALLDRMQELAKKKQKKALDQDVTESDAAFDKVVGGLKKQYPGGVLSTKQDFDDYAKKQAAKPKPKPKKQKPLTAAQKAQLEVDIRYPPESPGTKRNYGD